MAKRDIIAIGGSAGSGAVLRQVLGQLPADLPASVFVSTHVPSHSPGYLAGLLDTVSQMPVELAIDGRPIERSRVYLAVADRHLLIDDGVIRLGIGPRENMVRPSIDPMFRSAALAYGPRAVGVVLTGMLNDGASGLSAIKSVGGVAVVQHPLDAHCDSMPLAALDAVDADYVVDAADIAGVLTELTTTTAGPAVQPTENLAFEVDVAAGGPVGTDRLRRFAEAFPLICPECNGVLSEIKGERPLRFRCQIGHAHTAEVLAANTDGVDEAVRIAMRIMQERVTLVERMAQDARETGRKAVAELYDTRADEYRRYATVLRESAMLTARMRRRPVDEVI